MKKIILMAMLALSLASCQKDPIPDPDGEFLVYTEPEEDIDFSKYSSFHVVDSVLVVERGFKPRYSKTPAAESLVNLTVKNMADRGYLQVDNSNEADLKLALCYELSSTSTLTISMIEVDVDADEDEKPEQLWEAMITGFISYNHQYQFERLERGINKAFEQSQYIKK